MIEEVTQPLKNTTRIFGVIQDPVRDSVVSNGEIPNICIHLSNLLLDILSFGVNGFNFPHSLSGLL